MPPNTPGTESDGRAHKRQRLNQDIGWFNEAWTPQAITPQDALRTGDERLCGIHVDGNAQVHIGNTFIQNDHREVQAVIRAIQARDLSDDIRRWLRAPDAVIDYNVASSKRHEGTGRWFVKGLTFGTWLCADNAFLWLYGFAGCGKSVLCSTAIQSTFCHARLQPKSAVAFFFFTFNDKSKQDASALLRAILSQLSGQVAGLEEKLLQLKEQYKDSLPPVPTLLECLRQTILLCDRVYILLDALDESPAETSRTGVLSTINTLRGWRLTALHLLVTSRDKPDIRDELNLESDQTVTLRNDSVNQDISRYVEHRVEHDRLLRRWGDHRDKIKSHLAQRANGVFRWVDCQLQPLRQCPKSKYDLGKCLNDLPSSLEETYERMLTDIPDGCKERARAIFAYLCFSPRPLTVHELLDAIAVNIDEGRYDPDRRLQDADDILRVCPGLIEIVSLPIDDRFPIYIDENTESEITDQDKYLSATRDLADDPLWAAMEAIARNTHSEYVRIAHFSVQEYLTSPRILNGQAASFATSESIGNHRISKMCLIYLCNKDFLNRTLTPNLIKHYPLARFAARYWHHCYRLADAENLSELEDCAVGFFSNTTILKQWVRIYNIDNPRMRICYIPESPKFGTAVYYVSSLGFDGILRRLLSASQDGIDCLGAEGRPIAVASRKGYKDIVRLLVDAGAALNISNNYGEPALMYAVRRGCEQIVQILVDAGADVNSASWGGQSPLFEAVRTNHERIVQILVDAGADTNYIRAGWTPLTEASSEPHDKIVRLLIAAGADVNMQCSQGSPLIIASREGREGVVQTLLAAGANLDTTDCFDSTALVAASRNGHIRVVQALIAAGADVDSPNRYHSAVYEAAYHGHVDIMRILIAAGADVNVKDEFGGTLLAWAKRSGHDEIQRILHDAGATVQDD